MKWRVVGRDKVTGASIITTIEAATLEQAGELAGRKGIDFDELTEADSGAGVLPYSGPQSMSATPNPTSEQFGAERRTAALTAQPVEERARVRWYHLSLKRIAALAITLVAVGVALIWWESSLPPKFAPLWKGFSNQWFETQRSSQPDGSSDVLYKLVDADAVYDAPTVVANVVGDRVNSLTFMFPDYSAQWAQLTGATSYFASFGQQAKPNEMIGQIANEWIGVSEVDKLGKAIATHRLQKGGSTRIAGRNSLRFVVVSHDGTRLYVTFCFKTLPYMK